MAAILSVVSRNVYSFFVLLIAFFASGGCNNISCDKFHEIYKQQGLNVKAMPANAVSGLNLHICANSMSCCSQEMENSLKSLSQKQFQKSVQETLSLVRGTFSSGTSKFDEFFSVLLDNSERDLHEMFVQTYGLLYQQNTKIFQELFKDLKAYYKGRNLSLTAALNDFFVRLLKRMFELLNSSNDFTSNYLFCVVRHMKDLKPFGDVPINLSKQVKRAFVAARTFVQGLAIGRDVIMAISDIPPTQECTTGLMKMLHCPRCQGVVDTKPCSNYCLNTMKGCLAHHQELNTAWNDYIGALIMVANRLEGPFNIENVVEPIDVKISDAIMNFQNNGVTISRRIFQGCGQPNMGKRKKRDAATEKSDIEKLAFGKNWKEKNAQRVKPTTALGTSLDRLVRAIKTKIQLSKDYWSQLPYSICNSDMMSAKINEDTNCWNGQKSARYTANIQKDGVMNQGNNPEVPVKQTGNPVVILQIDKLKIITDKLQSAYSGYDVEWIDVDVESSGSGSGSGTDDEDTEVQSGSGDDVDTGSGYNPGRKSVHRHKNNRHGKGRGRSQGGAGKQEGNSRSEDDKNQYYFIPPSSTRSPHRTFTPSSAATLTKSLAILLALSLAASLSGYFG